LHDVSKVRKEADSSSSLLIGDDQLAENFADMSASLFAAFPLAVGVCIDDAMGRASSLATSQAHVQPSITPSPKKVDDKDDKLTSMSLPAWKGVRSAPSAPPASSSASSSGKGFDGIPPPAVKGHAKPKSGAKRENPSGGSGAGPAEKRARGRPARAKKDVAIEAVLEFSECPQHEKYFGPHQSFRRNLERHAKEFKTALEKGEEGLTENDETLGLKKQLDVCVSLSRTWAKEEARFTPAMAKELVSSLNYCLMSPVCDMPAPSWMRLLGVEYQAEVHRFRERSASLVFGVAELRWDVHAFPKQCRTLRSHCVYAYVCRCLCV
jgi:hypothetical protein